MAKRKFGASIIILCIAAVTLVSGTYAWFVVGGFAELFDIGFDVIEAGGGLLVQGDNNTAEAGTTDWGSSLDRVDFKARSFIVEEGRYRPISSKDGNSFIYVTMENNKFVCDTDVKTKTTTDIAEQIWFNDFTLYIKSTGDPIPEGAYMTVKLEGDAAPAARVAISIDGVNNGQPVVYSLDGEAYNAVGSGFALNVITDDNNNYIIDDPDTGHEAASLSNTVNPIALSEGENLVHIDLGSIPDVNTYKSITIRIWLEGNDPDCISIGEKSIAGKNLSAKISFKSEV